MHTSQTPTMVALVLVTASLSACSDNATPTTTPTNQATSSNTQSHIDHALFTRGIATLICWDKYRNILSSHDSQGFDKYAGLDDKLARIDTVLVDDELRDHLGWHIQWIGDMRKGDGSPLDVVGNIFEKGFEGSFSDATFGAAKVAALKKRCQDVRASLSDKYDTVFQNLDTYGPLPRT